MILVIVNHYVKQGMREAALQRIDGNGDRMSKMPGYLFRYRLVAAKNALKISTVTGWETQGHYDAWLEVRGERGRSGESPYERAESEVHIVEQMDVPGQAAPLATQGA